MEKTVFGLIGTGKIAQTQHLPNLTRAPHIRLKTVCDSREDVLGAMQAKYKVPNATCDYHNLLADPEIQAVVVATREDMQSKLTVEALQAGKHVYVEKPLATTTEECEAVVKAQKKAGKYVAVGFNRRFAPAYVRAKELLWKDGGPFNMYYRICDEYWNWGKMFPPRMRVIHELCHVFDILRWFSNSEVESVYCIESRADDEAYALRFKSGCVAMIMNSGYSTMDLPKERMEAISGKGGVTVEGFVEMRSYGYPGVPHVERFAGHSHPDREFTHKYLFEQCGADALHGLLRMGWEMRTRAEQGQTGPDQAESESYMKERSPHWNYMVDKGWLAALDHLALSIQTGKAPSTASAEDGLKASLISHAAIRSRDKGEIVRF